MKDSDLAKFLRSFFKIKDVRNSMSDAEIIALDYFECICYLYKGKEKPIVLGFKDDVNIWLETTVGLLELDSIPHDKGHLTNNVYELESLIDENGYEERFIIDLINKIINERWN